MFLDRFLSGGKVLTNISDLSSVMRVKVGDSVVAALEETIKPTSRFTTFPENDFELKRGNIERVFFGYISSKYKIFKGSEGKILPRWLISIKLTCVELDVSTDMELALYNKVVIKNEKIIALLLDILMYIMNNDIDFDKLEQEYNEKIIGSGLNVRNIADFLNAFYLIIKQSKYEENTTDGGGTMSSGNI